jgi:MinD-like ATPase involved in chromosome partitioning or flagellar assembly
VYIVTFYSFKGGVGRTFALVNVATELARSGRKVLLVDFDLEAPGIQTFDLLRPRKPHHGVVEFVSEFCNTAKVPDVRDFVFEASGVAQEGGRLWVMPAGKGDTGYRRKLAAIHWQALYRDADGFVMMEDLKAQWRTEYEPDYVFIDSRTGHTDVEGICVRQLPDAVVLLFFPNEQNLVGLREVVSDIRGESSRSRVAPPSLHFVLSNVPELDDDENILKERMRQFRSTLEFRSCVTIHNYPSLALVNQNIFTVERPKSCLTREYRRLKDAIIENNMKDREAALQFLRRGMRPHGFRFEVGKQDVESRIEEIPRYHPNDGELLFLIAMLRRHEGRVDEAIQLLDKAVDSGNRTGEVLLERAAGRFYSMDDREGASTDIEEALQRPDLSHDEIERAARLLGAVNEDRLLAIPDSPSVRSLRPGDLLSVVNAIMRFPKGLVAAISILREVLGQDSLTAKEEARAKNNLVLCLIGVGEFQEAKDCMAPGDPDPRVFEIADAFNLAMCVWGTTGKPPEEFFLRVAELHEDPSYRLPTANYAQCPAITFACLGKADEAIELIAEAKSQIRRVGEMEFSCWRYRNALPREFVQDCEEIARFIQGESILPAFMAENLKGSRANGSQQTTNHTQ